MSEVIKTVDIKPEWEEKFKELDELELKEQAIRSEKNMKRAAIWHEICSDLHFYGGMERDPEKKVINLKK